VAPKAKAAALKALELDDTLAEAQTSLATVRFNYDWDWAAAATDSGRAIETQSKLCHRHQRYSCILWPRVARRKAHADESRSDLDPMSISMISVWAGASIWRASTSSNRTTAEYPGHGP